MMGTVSYDNSGNLLTDPVGHTYTWNPLDQLASVDSTACGTNGECATYDALGKLVEVSNGSAYTEIWYTQAAKIFMNGSTIKYAYWPTPAGGTLMETGNGGAYYYQHKDWLGRAPIISKLTSSGTVYGDYAFAPYGEIYDTFGTVALDQENFTGDSLDLGVATMFHTDHRELNALEGRWISPDPAGAGWNLYAYGTDPNGGIDPSGLIFGDPIILAIEWSQGDGWGDFGCSLDGVGTGCNLLSSALQGGGIAPCPQCAIGQRVGADGNIYQDGQYNAPTVYWSAPDNLWVIAIKAVGYGESVVGTTNDGSPAANNYVPFSLYPPSMFTRGSNMPVVSQWRPPKPPAPYKPSVTDCMTGPNDAVDRMTENAPPIEHDPSAGGVVWQPGNRGSYPVTSPETTEGANALTVLFAGFLNWLGCMANAF
jgi:RHS repeat-associated protein